MLAQKEDKPISIRNDDYMSEQSGKAESYSEGTVDFWSWDAVQ